MKTEEQKKTYDVILDGQKVTLEEGAYQDYLASKSKEPVVLTHTTDFATYVSKRKFPAGTAPITVNVTGKNATAEVFVGGKMEVVDLYLVSPNA